MKQANQELREENTKLKGKAVIGLDTLSWDPFDLWTFSLIAGNSPKQGGREYSLLINYETCEDPPQRIDAKFNSIEELHELVQKIFSFDHNRMSLVYFDPQFNNELVALKDLQYLPSKAHVLIRLHPPDGFFPSKSKNNETRKDSANKVCFFFFRSKLWMFFFSFVDLFLSSSSYTRSTCLEFSSRESRF